MIDSSDDEGVKCDRSVFIDEDMPLVASTQRIPDAVENSQCENIKSYYENTERAWAMCANYAEKIAEIEELQKTVERSQSVIAQKDSLIAKQLSEMYSVTERHEKIYREKDNELNKLRNEISEIREVITKKDDRIHKIEVDLEYCQQKLATFEQIQKLVRETLLPNEENIDRNDSLHETKGILKKSVSFCDQLQENEGSDSSICSDSQIVSEMDDLISVAPLIEKLAEKSSNSKVKLSVDDAPASNTELKHLTKENKLARKKGSNTLPVPKMDDEVPKKRARRSENITLLEINAKDKVTTPAKRITKVNKEKSLSTNKNEDKPGIRKMPARRAKSIMRVVQDGDEDGSAANASKPLVRKAAPKKSSVEKTIEVAKKPSKARSKTIVPIRKSSAVKVETVNATRGRPKIKEPIKEVVEQKSDVKMAQAKPTKAIMLDAIPISEMSIGTRRSLTGKQTVEAAASELESNIIVSFQMAAKDKKRGDGAKKRLMQSNQNILARVSVEKLAEIMCRALLELEVADLWMVVKTRKEIMLPSNMVMSDIEKKFFGFATLLSDEGEWKELLSCFAMKFSDEVRKSTNSTGISATQLSRNFRCLIYVRKLILNVQPELDEQDKLCDRIVPLLGVVLNNFPPSHVVPVFCYLMTIDIDLMMHYFLNEEAKSLTHRLLRLHFTDSQEFTTVVTHLLNQIDVDELEMKDLLVLVPGAIEVTEWINEMFEEAKIMPQGMLINNEKISVSTQLLKIIKGCSSLFASKFNLELDHRTIIAPYFAQLLDILARAVGDHSREAVPEEKKGDLMSDLFADTLAKPKTVMSEQIKLDMVEAMTGANLGVIIGRIVSAFFLNCQGDAKKVGTTNDIRRSLDEVHRYFVKLEAIEEKSLEVELLRYGVKDCLFVNQMA